MKCITNALATQMDITILGSGSFPRGRFKNKFELLNLRSLKFSTANKINIFQCMGKIFCVEFQRVPIHWKIQFLYDVEIFRALGFMSSCAFYKRPPGRKFFVEWLKRVHFIWLGMIAQNHIYFHSSAHIMYPKSPKNRFFAQGTSI